MSNRNKHGRISRRGSGVSTGLPSIFLDGQTIADMVRKHRPTDIKGSYAFKWDYLQSELLSKYVGLDTEPEVVRKQAAIDKLLESEKTCKQINDHGYGSRCDNLNGILYHATKIVAEILGDVPVDLYETSSFTGGASTSRKRSSGHAYNKYNCQQPIDVTRRLERKAQALITATPLWCASGGYFNLNITLGNRVGTVPKKTDIDRAIAIEPDMNMHMQTAIGNHIRGRLKVFGIDLNDQSINQRLAYYGSITGMVSTIDLSAASDSISCRLVWDLLSTAWCDEIDSTRSTYGTLPDGQVIKWEKISSMGNGFTFELESLIFYALTKAVYLTMQSEMSYNIPDFAHWRNRVSVFGDDIICPSFMANRLILALDDIGFKTNSDKTFVSGPFRESCGKHYHLGTDVTPFYVRKPVDHVSRVIWLLNKLRKWSFCDKLQICDPSMHGLWLAIRRKYCPPDLLGGVDIENDSSVYSTELPRNTLVNEVRRRRIGGYRAFLSKAQNWGRSLDEHFITMKHQPRHFLDSSNGQDHFLCTVVDHVWKRKPFSFSDPNMEVSHHKYVFPKELT